MTLEILLRCKLLYKVLATPAKQSNFRRDPSFIKDVDSEI